MNLTDANHAVDEALRTHAKSLDLSSPFSDARSHKLTSADLGELSPRISEIPNLFHLNLTHNLIDDLAPLRRCTSLKWLSLSDNRISDLKPLTELTGLEQLVLSHNHIALIPSEIGKLKQLRLLNLYDNRIREIPSEIGLLTKLAELHVPRNHISSLPFEMGNLKELKILYLFENQISDITPLLELNKLMVLDLRRNKQLLASIPPEILEEIGKPERITNYFLHVNKSDTRPLNEAKIVVIGEADVGKTCFINRLVYGRSEETISTHGIQIHRWEDVRINGQNVQLNVWDFGGQEIMHSTHQFFFTKRTIYILIIDARKNEDIEKTEEWLKRVESFGGESPIIIVGNQIDQNKRNPSQPGVGYFEINRRGLEDKYRNIRGIYGLCSYDNKVINANEKAEYNKRFEEFVGELVNEIGNLQGIDTPFPLDWFALKEDLERMHDHSIPYISRDEYIANCLERQVRDKVSQTTLIEFLNEIGTIIYFSDLPDTMVFNPEWITKAVYAIVDNPIIKDEFKGIVKRKYLTTLLDPKAYPVEKHEYILNMMRKFELCVDVEPDQTFLLPDLLSTSQPAEVREEEWRHGQGFQYHYDTYLPNIFTRFIVKMYHYRVGDLYWRNGIVLKWDTSRALVKADVAARSIIITIKGGNRRSNQALLSQIRGELRKIHGKYEALNIKRRVPHPEYPQILKDYDELVAMEEDGEREVYAVEVRGKLMIRDWLDGIEPFVGRQGRAAGESRFSRDEYDRLFLAANGMTVHGEKSERTPLELQRKNEMMMYDEEAKRIARFRSFGMLLLIAGIAAAWVAIILYRGWEKMEVWTYILAVASVLFTYGLSAWYLDEYNPFSPRRTFEKERKRIYAKFEIGQRE